MRRPRDSDAPPSQHRFGLDAILQPTGLKRTLFFLACDLIIFAGSLVLSFMIRFEGNVPPEYRKAIPVFYLIAIGPKVVANMVCPNRSWRIRERSLWRSWTPAAVTPDGARSGWNARDELGPCAPAVRWTRIVLVARTSRTSSRASRYGCSGPGQGSTAKPAAMTSS